MSFPRFIRNVLVALSVLALLVGGFAPSASAVTARTDRMVGPGAVGGASVEYDCSISYTPADTDISCDPTVTAVDGRPTHRGVLQVFVCGTTPVQACGDPRYSNPDSWDTSLGATQTLDLSFENLVITSPNGSPVNSVFVSLLVADGDGVLQEVNNEMGIQVSGSPMNFGPAERSLNLEYVKMPITGSPVGVVRAGGFVEVFMTRFSPYSHATVKVRVTGAVSTGTQGRLKVFVAGSTIDIPLVNGVNPTKTVVPANTASTGTTRLEFGDVTVTNGNNVSVIDDFSSEFPPTYDFTQV